VFSICQTFRRLLSLVEDPKSSSMKHSWNN
jgi:hypothetical protein